MNINSCILTFTKSIDPSAEYYNIRFQPTNTRFSYETVYQSIYDNKFVTFDLSFIHTNMCSLAITSVDTNNNESNPTLIYLGDYTMAFLKTRRIKFDKSSSTDVASYNIRIVPANSVFEYTLPPANIAQPAAVSGSNTITVDLASLSNKPTVDGSYDVYITAADATGNESDPLKLTATFDFTPPAAPTNASIV